MWKTRSWTNGVLKGGQVRRKQWLYTFMFRILSWGNWTLSLPPLNEVSRIPEVSHVGEEAADVSQCLNTNGCEFCISPCGQHTGTQCQGQRGGSNILMFRIVMKMFQANLENIRNHKGINHSKMFGSVSNALKKITTQYSPAQRIPQCKW